MLDLKKIAEDLKIKYDVVYEVGVWKPEESHIKNLIPYAKKVMMFEAQEKYAELSRIVFKEYGYVTVHTVAIYKENLDSIKLIDVGSSSFIQGIASPSINVAEYNLPKRNVFSVIARTFDNYDEGNIDILACDIEGAEWFVLDKMKSRPKLICLETHFEPYRYVNPFMNEINKWMKNNGYVIYCNDVSDTVYKKI
jgi:uncharacterized repeat protein (TIGR04076 family)